MIWDYNARIDALDEQREELMSQAVDPETGEIDDAAIEQAMLFVLQKAELEMERDEWLEGLALGIKNWTAEAKAIREEEKALADRRKALENKIARREQFLQFSLAGEKFKTAKVTVSYRKSTAVETDDEFILWAKENNEFLRWKEPEVDKVALKDAIKQGKEVPFARIVEKESMTVK